MSVLTSIEARCPTLKEAFESLKPREFRSKPTVKRAAQIPLGAAPVLIETLDGIMEGRGGDWIIEGVNGEMYPCKDDVFKKSYEPNGWNMRDLET